MERALLLWQLGVHDEKDLSGDPGGRNEKEKVNVQRYSGAMDVGFSEELGRPLGP